MDEDELVDPKQILRKQVQDNNKCKNTWDKYNACAERIKTDTTGTKHCTGWYMDHLKCIDHHSAEKSFKQLK